MTHSHIMLFAGLCSVLLVRSDRILELPRSATCTSRSFGPASFCNRPPLTKTLAVALYPLFKNGQKMTEGHPVAVCPLNHGSRQAVDRRLSCEPDCLALDRDRARRPTWPPPRASAPRHAIFRCESGDVDARSARVFHFWTTRQS